MAVLQIKSEQFEEEVLKSDKPVLVDFWATWCGPCKMLSPVIDKVSEEVEDVKFVSVDVDESEELAIKYGISSIPCLIIFKDGAEKGRNLGVVPKSKVIDFIDQNK